MDIDNRKHDSRADLKAFEMGIEVITAFRVEEGGTDNDRRTSPIRPRSE